jgi:hypothetical protein
LNVESIDLIDREAQTRCGDGSLPDHDAPPLEADARAVEEAYQAAPGKEDAGRHVQQGKEQREAGRLRRTEERRIENQEEAVPERREREERNRAEAGRGGREDSASPFDTLRPLEVHRLVGSGEREPPRVAPEGRQREQLAA